MEEHYESTQREKDLKLRAERRISEETPKPVEIRDRDSEALMTRDTLERLIKERTKRALRRKWAGRSLIVFGVLLMIGSCPFYALSVTGSGTILAALALIGGGSALLAWRPKLKDTNEAVLIAMKYGNRLTATTLALEMDVSFNKAGKIIQELVRSGIAEIDLDSKDPDHTITYKIKGL
jgi:hypothetical protein